MKEYRIFYTSLVTLVFGMCFVYQSRLMPLLLLILTISPALSFIIMLINYFALKVRIEPYEVMAEKFEECAVGLNLHNRFVFPVSPIRIIGDFQSLHENEIGFSKKILTTDAPPLRTSVVRMPFKIPFRGEYAVKIYEVCVFDLFKIFRLRRKVNLSARIIILPREKRPSEAGKETETESESPASRITAHRSNMFNSLREYRDGDSIRNVHWKLTAKQDELIIKQMEQSVDNSAVIFNDFSADMKDSFLTRRMIDGVLETSLAITHRILQDGNSVVSCWQGVYNSEKYEAVEAAHYSYLYGTFTVLPQEPSPKSFDELIVLFCPEIKEHHTIYLITPIVDNTLLKTLEETGLSMRTGVTIITFTVTGTPPEIKDYITEKTKINLIEINDEAPIFDII